MTRNSPRPAAPRCDDVVRKQLDAGIDIGNNGEQQREAFFLYVRHRMSGFGGALEAPAASPTWSAIPASRRAGRRDQTRSARSVSNRDDVPDGDGRGALSRPRRDRGRMRRFPRRAGQPARPFAEPFLTAPSPGIVAAALRNDHYPTEDAYLAALGEALRVEYETIVGHGFLLQIDCAGSGDGAPLSYQDRPLADFVDFVERVVATINAALVNIPRDRVRLHACWGNYEGPHDCDVALQEILPILRRRRSAASCCRSPIRATRTNTACCATSRSTPTRSSSPA